MKVISDEAGRSLTTNEINFVKNNFDKANVSRMKYLGTNGMEIDSSDYNFHELCNKFSCLHEKTSTNVYFRENSSYAGRVLSIFKNKVCDSQEFKCLDVKVYYVTYNCIGWALGISKWLDPGRITNYIRNKGLTHEQAIERFIHEKSQEYQSSHISNIENIVHKTNFLGNLSNIEPFHNTISFYFDGVECKHGSRFLETLNTQTINQWTSKLGEGILITHETDDLLYDGSIYGNSQYYLDLIDHHNKYEEL